MKSGTTGMGVDGKGSVVVVGDEDKERVASR